MFFFCHPRQTSLTVTLACAFHTHKHTHTHKHAHKYTMCECSVVVFIAARAIWVDGKIEKPKARRKLTHTRILSTHTHTHVHTYKHSWLVRQHGQQRSLRADQCTFISNKHNYINGHVYIYRCLYVCSCVCLTYILPCRLVCSQHSTACMCLRVMCAFCLSVSVHFCCRCRCHCSCSATVAASDSCLPLGPPPTIFFSLLLHCFACYG